MAKYAQGFERKSSDTKNLIIMISAIVALIILAIGFAVLYNKVFKKGAESYATMETSEEYKGFFLTSYSKLLDQEEGDYIIYVCSTETSDSNVKTVKAYIDSYINGKTNVKLYLLDYADFDSTSDENEVANQEAVEAEIGYAVQGGYLVAVQNGKVTSSAKQIITDQNKVASAFKSLKKNESWLDYYNK